MKKRNNVIVVSGFFPYPTHFGGAFDILERIIGLQQLGFQIDLVCTYKEQPKQEHIDYVKTIVDGLFLVKRENKISNLLNFKPLQVVSRKNLKTIKLSKTYDFAILETEYVGMILENKSFTANKLFLRIQNNENIYFKELAKSTKGVFKKIYYFSDALKFKGYSKKVFNKVHRLWFISNDEVQSKEYSAAIQLKSIHLPSPVNSSFLTQKLSNSKVLFIGSLFMPNNIEGLDWYLKNVHPKLLYIEGYELTIVGGSGDKPEEYFINKYRKFDKVKLFCNVKDLDEFYSNSTLFINPMLHGAGVKLKTINAIVSGLPIVSTTKGSEGIGLIDQEMFFKADDANTFYKSIIKLFQMENKDRLKMVFESQKYLKENSYLDIMKNEFLTHN
jgi:polysaccharide biosynthesis protein PslH